MSFHSRCWNGNARLMGNGKARDGSRDGRAGSPGSFVAP